MIAVGIYGAAGYTGIELLRLIHAHPEAQVVFATSNAYAGQSLNRVAPGAPEVPLVSPQAADLSAIDLAFLCTPHGASAPIAMRALEAGARVIDLSADFRLKDPAQYQAWYGAAHPAPELLDKAVYGLTEINRASLRQARLVANPGCYPTCALLALYPLAKALLQGGWIVVDAKSGVSGAGREPSQFTHFVEVADNLKPYKLGRSHRHLPEMEQALGWWADAPPRLTFVPHLLPVPRGLLATIYAPLADGSDGAAVDALYQDAYGDEPFIQLLPGGEPATLQHVNHSNRCAIGWTLLEGMLVITSALDNLIKGASGQAVQNMNVMFGLDETCGLGGSG